MIARPIGALDAVIVVDQIREPLIRFASEEAVEPLEAHSKRPVVVGSRVACFIGRRLVPLANVECAVTGLLQYLANRRLTSRHPAIVAGIAGCGFGYHAQMIGVMVVAC